MSFSKTISTLRHQFSYSQQEVATKIGVARATYANMESGKRAPNLNEIMSLAELFSVSPQDLIDGTVTNGTRSEIKHVTLESIPEATERDVDPAVDTQKVREVLAYIIERIGARPNVGETVLYKLLYFIDFDYYEKTGKSVTGLTYIHNHYGPSPVADFKNVVDAMKRSGELEVIETKFFKNTQKKYLPTKRVAFQTLTADELKHIDDTLGRLGDKTAKELTELSHYDTPWVVAQQGKPLEYRYVFYRTKLTAVTEPEDDL